MKIKKIFTDIISLVFAAVLCLQCAPALFAADDCNQIIRIPYGYNTFLDIDDDGNVSGFYADFLAELANINNWKYEYVRSTWTEAVDMLENGGIDFLFPTNYSEERKKTMDYSALPTGYTSVGIFALEASDYNYEDYEAFDGARIACAKNSTNLDELTEYAQNHGFTFETVTCLSNDEMIQAVKNNKADLAVFSAANDFPDSKLVAVFSAEPVYITVKKGNSELMSAIDNGMQKLVKDNTDLMTETMRKTLVGDNGNISAFTAEERKFVNSGQELIVGFYEESEPLAYIDSKGEYKGIYIEFLNHIMEYSGFKFTLYPITRDVKWKDLLENGDIDFYIGASDLIVSQDEDIVTASSFMELSNHLVTKSDTALNQIDTPVIAITYAWANWTDYIEEELEKKVEYKYCRTSRECMLAVVKGKADAAFTNNLEFNYHKKNPRFAVLTSLTQYRYPTEINMAASTELDKNIISAVNKMISIADRDYIDTVSEESLNISYHSYTFGDYIYNSRFVLIIVGGIIIIIVISALFNRSKRKLKKEAREKEQDTLRIIAALSDDYTAIYYTDLDKDTCSFLRYPDDSISTAYTKDKHSEALAIYIEECVLPEYHDELRPLCSTQYIIERFKKENAFFIRYQVDPKLKRKNYYEMSFVNISENGQNRMVFGIRCVYDLVNAEMKQRQILEDALKNANRANSAKSDFLSMMSHDIRTPMNAIIGMTAIASAHAEEPDRVRDALGKISSSSQYLLSLINDVLDMSKIESGKFTLTRENINLTELLNELIEMVQPQIKEHRHTLTVDIKNIRHNDVIGDKLRIQQVFMNLMSNAIKYTHDGGKISFSVTEKNINTNSAGCYELVVSDNGIGMSPEFKEHVFEPFTRAEDLRISKTQGTGLGLPITKNIVHMMNGSIEIKSELHKGSTFIVTLFLLLQNVDELSENAHENADKNTIRTSDFSGKRILLVEDNELNREIAREILEMSELTVEEAEDGQIALDIFSKSEEGYYDMIFMDIQMPNLNGYETTKAIRKLERPDAKDIPIVAMTANAFVEDIKNSESAGMNDHLSKPIDFDKLHQILEKYLG